MKTLVLGNLDHQRHNCLTKNSFIKSLNFHYTVQYFYDTKFLIQLLFNTDEQM